MKNNKKWTVFLSVEHFTWLPLLLNTYKLWQSRSVCGKHLLMVATTFEKTVLFPVLHYCTLCFINNNRDFIYSSYRYSHNLRRRRRRWYTTDTKTNLKYFVIFTYHLSLTHSLYVSGNMFVLRLLLFSSRIIIIIIMIIKLKEF